MDWLDCQMDLTEDDLDIGLPAERPDAEAVEQLQQMFPNLSRVALVQALSATGGAVESAVNRLLEVAAAGRADLGSPVPRGPTPAQPPVQAEQSKQAEPQVGAGELEIAAVDETPMTTALRTLEAMLPDCDPEHLRSVLEQTDMRSDRAADQILSGPYPKRRRRASEAASSSRPREAVRGAGYWFDADARSSDDGKPPPGYCQEAKQLLREEFSGFGKPGLEMVFERSGRAYAIAWKRCYEAQGAMVAGEKPKAPLRQLKCPRKPEAKTTALKNKRLKDEVAFVKGWQSGCEEAESRAKAYKAYLAACEANGELLSCDCCCGEYVSETMIQCRDGLHLFCSACVTKYVETRLTGEAGAVELSCPSMNGCTSSLAPSELERVLSKELLQSYTKHAGKASLEKAMVTGCLSNICRCPFCDYFCVMESTPEQDKVFACRSDACGKASCRLCGEENHLPLRCSEVEKKTQTSYRRTVEESMSDALIRECPSCKEKGVTTRFVKESDCNKMTCPKCKNYTCYICNAKVPKKDPYLHFCQHAHEPGKSCQKCDKCELWAGDTKSKLKKLEDKRVADAAKQASEEYLANHDGESLEQLDILSDIVSPQSRPKRRASSSR